MLSSSRFLIRADRIVDFGSDVDHFFVGEVNVLLLEPGSGQHEKNVEIFQVNGVGVVIS